MLSLPNLLFFLPVEQPLMAFDLSFYFLSFLITISCPLMSLRLARPHLICDKLPFPCYNPSSCILCIYIIFLPLLLFFPLYFSLSFLHPLPFFLPSFLPSFLPFLLCSYYPSFLPVLPPCGPGSYLLLSTLLICPSGSHCLSTLHPGQRLG